MIETRGNLWTVPTEVRVITTNGFVKRNGACVMGRGCAKEAKDRYPGLDLKLGTMITQYGNRAMVLRINDGAELLATMPVKHNWWEVADLSLIMRSAQQLVEMADKFGWERILVPRPGCGNGQLNWDGPEGVRSFLTGILDDRFCIITF